MMILTDRGYSQYDLSDDIDGDLCSSTLQLKNLLTLCILAQLIHEDDAIINDSRDQRHEVTTGEARVEDGSPSLVLLAFQCYQALVSSDGPYGAIERCMLRQGVLNSDRSGNIRVDNCQDLVSKGPRVDIEDIWKIVLLLQIMDVSVRVYAWRKTCDQLAHDLQIAQDWSPRRFWLASISIRVSVRRKQHAPCQPFGNDACRS